MNKIDRGRPSWNEQEIDALLREFFETEMPEDVRRLPTSTETAPLSLPGGRSTTHRPSGKVAGLVATATVLCLALTAFWTTTEQATDRGTAVVDSTPDHPATLVQEDPPSERNSVARSAAREWVGPGSPELSAKQSSPIRPFSLWEPSFMDQFDGRLEQVDRITYPTPAGPVELQTRLRWTNVPRMEPEAASVIEWMVPELEIEIFDIGNDE